MPACLPGQLQQHRQQQRWQVSPRVTALSSDREALQNSDAHTLNLLPRLPLMSLQWICPSSGAQSRSASAPSIALPTRGLCPFQLLELGSYSRVRILSIKWRSTGATLCVGEVHLRDIDFDPLAVGLSSSWGGAAVGSTHIGSLLDKQMGSHNWCFSQRHA